MLAFAADTAAGPEAVRVLGIIVAALCAAAAILAGGVAQRAWAMLGALAVTPVLLVLSIWYAPQLAHVREHPLIVLLAGLVVAAIVVVPLALLFDRRRAWLPLVAFAALPFRVPVEAGGQTANLLVPLYLVIAAAALSWAVPRIRDPERFEPPTANGRLEQLLAASLVLYALQSAYSASVDIALEQTVFFYVPFALLFAVLRDVEWTPRRLQASLLVLLGLAVVFVGVGFVEYATRTLLFNPRVIASNELEPYFRVNSLFFDPNIYGRFLVIVMLGLAAVLLWVREAKYVAGAAAALALLWGGLLLTLSQSSYAALVAGLFVLAALRFPPWRVGFALLGAAIVGLVVVLAFSSSLGLDFGNAKKLDDATSGRYDLMRGGVELAADRPVWGWGSGSFADEYLAHDYGGRRDAVAASHTIPITVSAEQGVIGLALYVALLITALWRLATGARGDPYRAVVLAGLVAIIVHTWMYASFLEDPLVWTLLAVGVALARSAPRVRARSARSPDGRTRSPAPPSARTAAG